MDSEEFLTSEFFRAKRVGKGLGFGSLRFGNLGFGNGRRVQCGAGCAENGRNLSWMVTAWTDLP